MVKSGFSFFDHTADIGLKVWGDSLSDVLEQGAAGLYAALGELKPIAGSQQVKTVIIRADSAEHLFHDWLSELLFEFETGHRCYRNFIFNRCEETACEAQLVGSNIDLNHSRLGEEIKAVTYHDLKVGQVHEGRWQAKVILDV